MPDILAFNPNRGLSFDIGRARGFDPGRTLLFDSDRNLAFDPGRDLPFGKRGVVFRGFVCPICGASVTEDQPSCSECGAVFDRAPPPKTTQAMPRAAAPQQEHRPPAIPPSTPLPPASPLPPPPSRPPTHAPPAHRRPPPVRVYPPAPKSIDVHDCPFCGARVATTSEFCWNCGNRMYRPGA